MVKVRQMLVSESKWDIKCPYEMQNPEYVTVHNTANSASANDEISYMISNNNEVSFHYAVDNVEVVQGIVENRNTWNSGDGGNGTGNRKSISVEICYSTGSTEAYTASEENAVIFIGDLLKRKGWGVDKVVQHYKWSGKNCPHRIRAEGTWEKFLDRIEAYMNGASSAPPSQSTTPPPTQSSNEVAPIPTLKKGSKGNEVKKLQSILGGLTVDGDFGSKTESALKSWQKNNGLTADGIYGNKSQAKMQEQLDGNTTTSNATTYRVYTNGKWYNWITGYNNENGNGYAGVKNSKIMGVQIQGDVEYQVHTTSGKWYSWIKGYNTTNSMGYAGDLKSPIDAIRIKNKTYRVAPCDAEGNDYYSWITHYNTSNDMGYAGVYGKAIDQLQIQ